MNFDKESISRKNILMKRGGWVQSGQGREGLGAVANIERVGLHSKCGHGTLHITIRGNNSAFI